ncbi:hypothetical protein [Actinomadura miaoliensis]
MSVEELAERVGITPANLARAEEWPRQSRRTTTTPGRSIDGGNDSADSVAPRTRRARRPTAACRPAARTARTGATRSPARWAASASPPRHTPRTLDCQPGDLLRSETADSASAS